MEMKMTPIFHLIEREDSWLLELSSKVTSCRLGLGFDIGLFDAYYPTEVSIGSCFRLSAGTENVVFDAHQPITLGPALSIINKVVHEIVAFKTGRLEVRFRDGVLITTEPDPMYESWQIRRTDQPDKLTIVCGPGGNLSVWYDANAL